MKKNLKPVKPLEPQREIKRVKSADVGYEMSLIDIIGLMPAGTDMSTAIIVMAGGYSDENRIELQWEYYLPNTDFDADMEHYQKAMVIYEQSLVEWKNYLETEDVKLKQASRAAEIRKLEKRLATLRSRD